MGLLRRGREFDRSELLEAAARARTRGRPRRAIALYRRVLAREPRSMDLHARLAPLLAETGSRLAGKKVPRPSLLTTLSTPSLKKSKTTTSGNF